MDETREIRCALEIRESINPDFHLGGIFGTLLTYSATMASDRPELFEQGAVCPGLKMESC